MLMGMIMIENEENNELEWMVNLCAGGARQGSLHWFETVSAIATLNKDMSIDITRSSLIDPFCNDRNGHHFQHNYGDNQYEYDEDDDHIFRKHVGDNGLLHSEHLANHNVSACNGKPENMKGFQKCLFCNENKDQKLSSMSLKIQMYTN